MHVFVGQKTSGHVHNSALSMCLFEAKLFAKDCLVQNEPEYIMENNPLYVMRAQSFMKPHGTNTSQHGIITSPDHHYEHVTVRKV